MEKKVIIWGANKLGRYAVEELKREGCKILCIVDNSENLQGKKINEIPVVSFEEMQGRTKETNAFLLLAVMNSKSVFEVLGQIADLGYENVGILKPRVEKYQLAILSGKEETKSEVVWYIRNGKRKRVIPRLEINLIDNCNLNCMGCTHFSSLYETKSILPFTQFESELRQIRTIGEFVRIRLLGGEPFLIPELMQYIKFAREIFPETDIEVVTNGLLIPKADEELLKVIRGCEVSVVISPYKPTMAMKEKIVRLLDEYEIRWSFDGEMTTSFSRQLTLHNDHDGYLSSQSCISSGCLFLRNGKIYKCPIAGLINDFMKYYGLEKVPDTGISIYDDPEEVYQYIEQCARKASVICGYCSEHAEMIEWSVCHEPCLNDWLYCSGNA